MTSSTSFDLNFYVGREEKFWGNFLTFFLRSQCILGGHNFFGMAGSTVDLPPLNLRPTPPGVFYTYFYNHARRLRLEKLLYIDPFRSSSGYFKPLLGPDGGFASETAARRFQK
jgi:hypothetical protein